MAAAMGGNPRYKVRHSNLLNSSCFKPSGSPREGLLPFRKNRPPVSLLIVKGDKKGEKVKSFTLSHLERALKSWLSP